MTRELHDSIAQGLSVQKVQISLLRDALRRQHAMPAERVLVELDAGVSESLCNVRKHAHMRAAGVELQQASQWRVEVGDDGRGFTAGTVAADETHLGLRIRRKLKLSSRVQAAVHATARTG